MVKIRNFTTTQINELAYSSGRLVYDSTLKICKFYTDTGINSFLSTDENGALLLSNAGNVPLLTVDSTISSGNSDILFNTNGNDWSLRSGGALHATIPNTFSIYDNTNSLYRLLIDNTGNIDIVGHNSSTIGLKLGGTLITSSATELNYLDLTTGAGTAQASKALVLDSSSNITGINSLSATTLVGTLSTPAQTNITSLGTLTSLTLSGGISGITTLSASGIVTLTNSTVSTSTTTGALVITGGLGVGGTINATNIGGTLTTVSQPNITSLGTLTSLTLSGAISGVTTISASGIVSLTNTTASTTTTTGALIVTGGIGIDGTINATNINGTIITANQPNITSIGTLTSLRTSGNVGINTTTPDRQLEINNTTGNCLRLTFNDANGSAVNFVDFLVSVTGDLTVAPSGGDTIINGALSGITTLSASGIVTLTNATLSTTTGTGALVVTGGLGIGGAINSGGTINSSGMVTLTNATASTTPTTGALIVTGGVGIGGAIRSNNLLAINGALSGVTTLAASGIVTLTNNTVSTTPTTGALVVTGGVGIGGAIRSGGALTINGVLSGVTTFAPSGIVTLSNATASTTTTTGALVVTGGVGIGGAIQNGGTINSSGIVTLTNATASTTSTNGALIVSGGVGIGGAIRSNNLLAINGALSGVTTLVASGIVTLTNATASTTPTTGALVVTGGVGIGGAIRSGGALTINGVLSGVTTFAPSGIVTLSNATASTSTTTGALIVTGGVGIGGAIRCGGEIHSSGIVTLTNATASTTSTTGALVVTGGVGIGGAIRSNNLLVINGALSGVTTLAASGVVTLSSNTASTSTTTGALVVTGGVGIAGSIFCGTRIGVNITPVSDIHFKQVSNTTGGITIERSNNTNNWRQSITDTDQLLFSYNGTSRGFLSSTGSTAQINFTGQHRNICTNGMIMAGSIANYAGRIVYASGSYYNLNGGALNINEALPMVVLTNTLQDKRVFGVISNIEEDNSERTYTQGMFVSVFERIEIDNRLIINSVGEGMVWICNKNGNFTNGDYITTSTVTGYGQLQNDDFLHSYTVAKITQDCDFSTPERYVSAMGMIVTQAVYEADTMNKFKCNLVGCTYHCG